MMDLLELLATILACGAMPFALAGYPCCCTPPVEGEPCGTCKEGVGPSQYQLEMSGWADGACPNCDDMDGTYVLDYFTGSSQQCDWTWENNTPSWPIYNAAAGCEPAAFGTGMLGRPLLLVRFLTASPNTPPMTVDISARSRWSSSFGNSETIYNFYRFTYTYPNAASQPNCTSMDPEEYTPAETTYTSDSIGQSGSTVACDGSAVTLRLTAL